jgi:hypothetical protein
MVIGPPDFLWCLMALAKFMRLSLQKGAHAASSGATYRKSGTGMVIGQFFFAAQASPL